MMVRSSGDPDSFFDSVSGNSHSEIITGLRSEDKAAPPCPLTPAVTASWAHTESQAHEN